jgi:hypothetical protein
MLILFFIFYFFLVLPFFSGENFMVDFFQALYDIEAVMEDAVHTWKRSGPTSGEPKFERALKDVERFIHFLETAEEEN